MRIGIISDVHGNRLALEAVLEDLARQGVDTTLNLGDIVSGPLEPKRTADILMDLDIPTVRGNHERMLIDNPPERLGPIDRFAQQQLDARHKIWMNQLPKTLAVLDEVFMCHGTPSSDEGLWLDSFWDGRSVTMPDEAAVEAEAAGFDFPVLLCGHTHIPRAVRLRDGRLIVNPGSVGLQFNHGAPDARYALVERRDGVWSATFRAVPYDHETAAQQATTNGFPQWREALVSGWVGARGLF